MRRAAPMALAATLALSTLQAAAQVTAQVTAQMTAQVSAPADPASAAAGNTAQPQAQPSRLRRAEGLVLLDYQAVPVRGGPSLDLMGLHVLSKAADGLYLGMGAYGPLFKGEYGGFMAFDVTAHLQRQVWGPLFADASLSAGGGGGGKSTQQSVVLSGTGGFMRASVGLGYEFTGFALGLNLVRTKFRGSAIDGNHWGVVVQLPFSTLIGPYAGHGARLSDAEADEFRASASESTWTLGLTHVAQIHPQGSYQGSFEIADFQFSQFMAPSLYWYASLGVGYRGIPLYNQMVGGLGYRLHVAPRLNLQAQFGVGSGGYAPEKIDTGAGLLIYPKVSAEYELGRHFSASLDVGYLAAPKGSSRNATWGASLHYHPNYHPHDHPQPRAAVESSDALQLKGQRLSVFQQTEFHTRYRDLDRAPIRMLSVQLDRVVSPHVYVPLQGSIAYVAYLGYPGYGEILGGLGLQTAHEPGDRLQLFGQFLAGANVHGLIAKAGVGLNVALSEGVALHATVGRTQGPASGGRNFHSDYAGLGLSYLFSTPGW